MRILVIEDEEHLRDQVCQRFRSEGYVVDEARDGEEGYYFGKEYPIDMAVVDIGLPKRLGTEVIQQWRGEGVNFPVLILTARGRWQEKVEGLEAGADDYLTKPFHMEELIARSKALLRRAAGWSKSLINCEDVVLDLTAQKVTVKQQEIDLTAFEYKVLEYLMMHAGKVISKSELTEHIYEQDYERDSNVIEVFIGRLRKKLDPCNEKNPIETMRGRGYVFTLKRTE